MTKIPSEISKADMLQAISAGTALVNKPILRWPREVMIYLGLSRTGAQRFLRYNGIQPYCFTEDLKAKFVRRLDLDKALKYCKPFKGRN